MHPAPPDIQTKIFVRIPRPLIERLNADLRKVIAERDAGAWLRSTDVAPKQLTSSHYWARLKAEVATIDDLIRQFNIKLD